MAEIANRKSADRTRLGSVIPLSTPYVLFIDPNSACNFECTFCPTGDRGLMKKIGRYQGGLSLDDFQKILDDCRDFGEKLKVLRLYKDGEPLLNKNIYSMIELAKKSNCFDSIDTTSNGLLLTRKNSENLVSAGLNLINISVDGLSEDQFFHFTKRRVNFKNFVDQIKYLYEIRGDLKIVIKTTSEIIGEDKHQEFLDVFSPYCDKIFVENTSPCWPDFDVEERMGITIEKGLYGNEIIEQTACPYLFYSVSVNSDMKVSACFVDWSRDLIVGDLRNASLKDVWHSDLMNSHRMNHILGNRKSHPICGKCGQISHCGPDSIEEDLPIIKEKMMSSLNIEEGQLAAARYSNTKLP